MNIKDATRLEIYPSSLDEAIAALTEARKAGQNVVYEFSGHPLYSANITEDGAYLQVTDMTKADYMKAIEQDSRDFKERFEGEKQQARERESMLNDAREGYYEQGEEFFGKDEAKAAKWKECVDKYVGTPQGKELSKAILAMGLIDEGNTMGDVVRQLGTIDLCAAGIVMDFHPKGREFGETAFPENLDAIAARFEKQQAEKQKAKDPQTQDGTTM